ncbi:hypothetical protein, partial [Porphyromonas cangingivalis]|uniref:hypothetical protein n=1 Tax=Porphyromonas cangingivalis TaxID=36874 RepID=UPI002430D59F
LHPGSFFQIEEGCMALPTALTTKPLSHSRTIPTIYLCEKSRDITLVHIIMSIFTDHLNFY